MAGAVPWHLEEHFIMRLPLNHVRTSVQSLHRIISAPTNSYTLWCSLFYNISCNNFSHFLYVQLPAHAGKGRGCRNWERFAAQCAAAWFGWCWSDREGSVEARQWYVNLLKIMEKCREPHTETSKRRCSATLHPATNAAAELRRAPKFIPSLTRALTIPMVCIATRACTCFFL